MKFGQHILKSSGDAFAGRHEPEGVRVLSHLYWQGMLVVFTIIIVGVFLYGIWGLLRVLHGLSVMADVSGPPPPALNRTSLDATVQGFEARRAQFDLLKTRRSTTIPDPSR